MQIKLIFTINYFFNPGPAIGSFLYDVGGFPLPFFSTGTLALLIAIMLVFSIPDVQSQTYQSMEGNNKRLTMKGIANVCISFRNFLNLIFLKAIMTNNMLSYIQTIIFHSHQQYYFLILMHFCALPEPE